MWGARYEYYKLCLEDTTSCELLCDVAEHGTYSQSKLTILRRQYPAGFVPTALNKPDNRVRGIASGDTLRRLASKTLAKQF
eukprot:8291550-Pyramimonas_sp.AAC.1